jgi:hypothetical protein
LVFRFQKKLDNRRLILPCQQDVETPVWYPELVYRVSQNMDDYFPFEIIDQISGLISLDQHKGLSADL